jgi:peptide deformylase
MSEIIQKDNPILREVAKEVPIEAIKSRKIETILRRMMKALENEEDGIAIAAPQIGESLRIFVVSKRIFEIMAEEKSQKKSKRENLDDFMNEMPDHKDIVFINPTILKTSKTKALVEEGCLSVRWLYGKVERAEKALVKAYNEEGHSFTLGGSGLLAQVFQHEIDHLNGTLFIDKAKNLKEIPPEKTIS